MFVIRCDAAGGHQRGHAGSAGVPMLGWAGLGWVGPLGDASRFLTFVLLFGRLCCRDVLGSMGCGNAHAVLDCDNLGYAVKASLHTAQVSPFFERGGWECGLQPHSDTCIAGVGPAHA